MRNTGASGQHRMFQVRDVVLAKLAGYPMWPAIIVDPDALSPKERAARKGRPYVVRFIDQGEFGFCDATDLKPLTPRMISQFLAKPPHTVRRHLRPDLIRAYAVASEAQIWYDTLLLEVEKLKRIEKSRETGADGSASPAAKPVNREPSPERNTSSAEVEILPSLTATPSHCRDSPAPFPVRSPAPESSSSSKAGSSSDIHTPNRQRRKANRSLFTSSPSFSDPPPSPSSGSPEPVQFRRRRKRPPSSPESSVPIKLRRMESPPPQIKRSRNCHKEQPPAPVTRMSSHYDNQEEEISSRSTRRRRELLGLTELLSGGDQSSAMSNEPDTSTRDRVASSPQHETRPKAQKMRPGNSQRAKRPPVSRFSSRRRTRRTISISESEKTAQATGTDQSSSSENMTDLASDEELVARRPQKLPPGKAPSLFPSTSAQARLYRHPFNPSPSSPGALPHISAKNFAHASAHVSPIDRPSNPGKDVTQTTTTGRKALPHATLKRRTTRPETSAGNTPAFQPTRSPFLSQHPPTQSQSQLAQGHSFSRALHSQVVPLPTSRIASSQLTATPRDHSCHKNGSELDDLVSLGPPLAQSQGKGRAGGKPTAAEAATAATDRASSGCSLREKYDMSDPQAPKIENTPDEHPSHPLFLGHSPEPSDFNRSDHSYSLSPSEERTEKREDQVLDREASSNAPAPLLNQEPDTLFTNGHGSTSSTSGQFTPNASQALTAHAKRRARDESDPRYMLQKIFTRDFQDEERVRQGVDIMYALEIRPLTPEQVQASRMDKMMRYIRDSVGKPLGVSLAVAEKYQIFPLASRLYKAYSGMRRQVSSRSRAESQSPAFNQVLSQDATQSLTQLDETTVDFRGLDPSSQPHAIRLSQVSQNSVDTSRAMDKTSPSYPSQDQSPKFLQPSQPSTELSIHPNDQSGLPPAPLKDEPSNSGAKSAARGAAVAAAAQFAILSHGMDPARGHSSPLHSTPRASVSSGIARRRTRLPQGSNPNPQDPSHSIASSTRPPDSPASPTVFPSSRPRGPSLPR